MFSFGQRVFLFVAVIIFPSCTPTSTLVNVPTRSGVAVETPVYKDGDSWIYEVKRDGDTPEEFGVTYRNDEFDSDNAEIWSGTAWVTVLRDDSDLEPLDFPLIPGKSWRYVYRHTGPRGRTHWRHAEVKVIGPVTQPIKTAAGQFKAVELQRYERWTFAKRNTTYFYSPETKSVIKLISDLSGRSGQQHYELELLKYSAGK